MRGARLLLLLIAATAVATESGTDGQNIVDENQTLGSQNLDDSLESQPQLQNLVDCERLYEV